MTFVCDASILGDVTSHSTASHRNHPMSRTTRKPALPLTELVQRIIANSLHSMGLPAACISTRNAKKPADWQTARAALQGFRPLLPMDKATIAAVEEMAAYSDQKAAARKAARVFAAGHVSVRSFVEDAVGNFAIDLIEGSESSIDALVAEVQS